MGHSGKEGSDEGEDLCRRKVGGGRLVRGYLSLDNIHTFGL